MDHHRQIVFAAIERFARRLRASLGLVMKPSAYGCYSMGHDLTQVCYGFSEYHSATAMLG